MTVITRRVNTQFKTCLLSNIKHLTTLYNQLPFKKSHTCIYMSFTGCMSVFLYIYICTYVCVYVRMYVGP